MGIPDELVVERTAAHSYPEDDIDVLVECIGVDKRELVGYELSVFDGFSKVGRIEYYLFRGDETGYIGWLEVDEEWRQQGIATALRQRAIDHLLDRGANEIWSGPVAPEIQSMVAEQGFEPADIKYSDYYVYRN